jgi:glycosyltransferase involved in cell wall biosynthesis
MIKIGFIYPNNPLTNDIGGGVSYLQYIYLNRDKYPDIKFEFISSSEEDKYGTNICTISRSKKPLYYALSFLKYALLNPDFKRFNVLHFNHNFLLWIGLLLKKKNQKIVLTYHGLTGTYIKQKSSSLYPILRFVLVRVERLMLMRVDKVIFVSESIIRDSKHLFNIDIKYEIIPAFFDTDVFEKKLKPCVDLKLVWTGRLSDVKNPEKAINIFHHLKKISDGAVSLTINGTGELMEKCKRIASDDVNIIFNGHVKKELLPLVYEDAFILIVTSKSEASPTVIKEALALGIYVMSSDVGDVKDHINSENGKVFSSISDEEIAQEIFDFYSLKKSLQLWRHRKGVIKRDVFSEITNVYKNL